MDTTRLVSALRTYFSHQRIKLHDHRLQIELEKDIGVFRGTGRSTVGVLAQM